jgi:hypothetical protein
MWFHPAMSDDPHAVEPAPDREDDPDLQETRALLAPVEELRALLAPLSPEDRERVLELARHLAEHPGSPGPAQ